VDPGEYHSIYRELTSTCRELASADDEARRDDYKRLEATVRPWLSLKVLDRTDRAILDSLLDRCRQVDRELGAKPLVDGRVVLAVLLPVGLVALSFVGWSARGLLFNAMEHVQGWSAALWLAARRASDLEKLFALCLIAACLSVIIVSRAARS
jgi:hypothetical protein